MDLLALKKYFDDGCSQKEAEEVLRWIENEHPIKDLESEFNLGWQRIKVNTGNYHRWHTKLKKIHEQIEMEKLYDTLELYKKPGEVPSKTKDRPAISLHNQDRLRSPKKIIRWISVTLALFLIPLIVLISNLKNKPREVPGISMIEKSTEKGQKLTIHLNDGTKVMLNAASSLTYSEDFNEFDRKTYLSGEAFFEVSKDASKPFVVVTEDVITTALGTSFNILSKPEETRTEVALVAGKVMVNRNTEKGSNDKVILLPGEMANIYSTDSEIIKSSFDLNEKISWKDGMIFFRNASFTQVRNKLENWYGVEFAYEKDPSKPWEFSGKFEDETLENILISLQFGHDFEYEIDGKVIKLKFN